MVLDGGDQGKTSGSPHLCLDAARRQITANLCAYTFHQSSYYERPQTPMSQTKMVQLASAKNDYIYDWLLIRWQIQSSSVPQLKRAQATVFSPPVHRNYGRLVRNPAMIRRLQTSA